MSDQSQGSGWWQAADGKWYPPEQHPDYAGGATQAVPAAEPPPTAAMPTVPPAVPPGPPPMAAGSGPGPVGPPPGSGSSHARWIVIGAIVAAIVLIAAFLLLRSDDKKTNVAASSSSSSSSKSSSSDSSSSSSSSSKSSSSSSSSSSSESAGQASKSEIDKRLIKAKDLGADFTDSTFTPDNTSPTPCGGDNINKQVPPTIDTGNDAQSGVAFFEEEVLVFGSEADANKALQLAKDAVNCPQPTVKGGGPLNVNGPNDVSQQLQLAVDDAIEFDIQTEESQGKVFFIRSGNVAVTFEFVARTGTDTSKLPNEIDIVNLGLKRLAA